MSVLAVLLVPDASRVVRGCRIVTGCNCTRRNCSGIGGTGIRDLLSAFAWRRGRGGSGDEGKTRTEWKIIGSSRADLLSSVVGCHNIGRDVSTRGERVRTRAARQQLVFVL